MSRTLKIAAGTAGVAAATLALASPASAGPPDRIPIDNHEVLRFDLCGLPNLVDLRETGTLTIAPKGRDGLLHFQLRVSGSVTHTNLDTGRSVYLERELLEKDIKATQGAGDLIFIKGESIIHERDYGADRTLAFRTVGRVAYQLVVDSQGTETPDDDEVVSEEYAPLTGRNDRADVDFCVWYAAETS